MAGRVVRAAVERLRDLFEGAGAQVVETAVLQPAEVLLDLYGEDIRARAYVTSDAAMAMGREVFGIPAPGHEYWNDQTITDVAARWPGWDMAPYRDAIAGAGG